MEGKKSEVFSEEVSLLSYPNPTLGQGTTEYALPGEAEVRLRLYDVLGRHTARLETSRLSSGVCFGRFTAGVRTRTLRITVVQ